MKIALALIVKGSNDEAKFLDRCLGDVSKFFSAVYVTITHKYGEPNNSAVMDVCKKYNANISHFTWVNDFAAARNFNWKQVPKEYDYIMWLDADDTLAGLKAPLGLEVMNNMFRDIKANPEIDAWTMQYYYEHDENFNPVTIHTKTQIFKNDGCVEWTGRIHEDFKENREMKVKYLDYIKRIHLTTKEHSDTSFDRNLEIAKEEYKDKPNDPRSYFNLGNAYIGMGKNTQARKYFKMFLETSGSDAEMYIIYQRLSDVEFKLGNKDRAVEYLKLALGTKPELPDAYFWLGYLYFELGDMDRAEHYLLWPLATKLQPQYQKMVFYNPRDYDYNPMKALAKVYFRKNRPDLALPMLKGCLAIYPDDKQTQGLVKDMEKESDRLTKVIETTKHIETLGKDKEKILYAINKLPIDLQSHPEICRIRNMYEIKTESSGKDIAYYCGETAFDWNPDLFKTKGFGGSEEAVVNLSKEWAKQGYNVTVYNSCGVEPMVRDGVTYKPWWSFNAKDKWDHLIVWRHPKMAEYDMNVSNLYIDLHDVISEGEFNEKRLKKINKIFVKTNAHRVLFPNIPDEKFAIIPNGMDFDLFDQDVEKDPYLLINTSSPDRSMDVLPKLFKEVKKRVPQARLKWAYGWDNYDTWYAGDKKMMEWRNKIADEMKEAGIEDCGRLSQKECAKLYLEGSIMAYPSDFYEIDCISIKKAQACGAIPVTTDFAAFNESNFMGIKVHTDRTIKNWSLPYQVGFGTKYEKAQKEWVDTVVDLLNGKIPVIDWNGKSPRDFEWPKIAAKWTNIFK